jgi:hypothetical protein
MGGGGAEDARSWYRIALASGDPGAASARSAVERASDLLRSIPAASRRRLGFAPEVEATRALAAAAAGRVDAALEILSAASRDLGDGAEVRFANGLVLQRAGRHVAALERLAAALAVSTGPLPAPLLAAAGRRAFRSALAESLHVVGRRAAARREDARARAEAPAAFNVFTEPLDSISRAPDAAHALGLLADAARVGRDSADAWLRAAAILIDNRRDEAAAAAIEKAAAMGADPSALFRRRQRHA